MNERLSIHTENSPTPYQLATLASVAMSTGSALNKVRKSKKISKLHYFVDELEYVTDVEDELLSQRRRIAVKIGKKTQQIVSADKIHRHEIGLPDWRMDVFDTHWYEQSDRQWQGARTLYRFAWDSQNATRAEKVTKTVPTHEGAFGIIDDLAAVKDYEILPEMIDAEDQYKNVTEGDLDMLIDDMDEYFTALKSTRPPRSLLQ
jgi:hypothetical protein